MICMRARRLGQAGMAALALSAGVALSGCGSIGAGAVLDARGPVNTSLAARANLSEPAQGALNTLAGKFNSSAIAASASVVDQPKLNAMLETGLDLIDANCNDYFDRAGQHQTWLIVARDIVQTVSSLGAGALALQNGNDEAVQAVTFGSSAIYAGMDVYTRNYLFGAENVDSVKTLIRRALGVHRDAVLAARPTTYGGVYRALLDNQSICLPRRIASLTREAIRTGDVVAAPTTNAAALLVAQAENVARSDIGETLKLVGQVNDTQLGSLWWLLKRATNTTAELEQINTNLKSIAANENPFNQDGTPKAEWTHRARVIEDLGRLSPATQAALDAWIASERARLAAKPPQNSGGSAPLYSSPTPSLPPILPTQLGSSRVEIQIR